MDVANHLGPEVFKTLAANEPSADSSASAP
jgi:hypothetical protein